MDTEQLQQIKVLSMFAATAAALGAEISSATWTEYAGVSIQVRPGQVDLIADSFGLEQRQIFGDVANPQVRREGMWRDTQAAVFGAQA